MKDKVTISTFQEMKKRAEKIVMLTAYDAPTARLLNEVGVDGILVGDSVGNVLLGYENTIPVSVEEMLHHLKAVKRGNSRALLAVDMPYLSYELDPKEAVRNAGRLVKEGGAEAVKLEGGLATASVVKALLAANIPVMGHIGMTPQSVHKLGGYRVQGRGESGREKLITEAKVLEAAGCFAVVLECVPSAVAAEITEKLSIPTIGIGAGPSCDGQILVIHDLLGLSDGHVPRFVRKYETLREKMLSAVRKYRDDVRAGSFPSPEESYD